MKIPMKRSRFKLANEKKPGLGDFYMNRFLTQCYMRAFIAALTIAIVHVIATDPNGYVPTHNNQFAKPPTGNFEVDLVNSRSKRLFNDRTGARCGAHTKSMLLQTYKRDTGEIMHDLSVPIFVAGRHWGGFESVTSLKADNVLW